jgi:hypothetical protein
MRLAYAAGFAIALALPAGTQAQPFEEQWKLVDEGLGRGGTTQPDGIRRYSFPRSDLNVQLDGVTIKPALALGTWLAFHPMGNEAMVMGDLVLTHEEVNPVLTELLAGGLKVTALHNHLLRSSPTTMYMHVEGRGDPWKLAVALRTALARSRTPIQAPSQAAQASIDLHTAALDRIMGRQGKANGGVYQFTAPRAENIVDGGMEASASMGTATVLNFQPAGDGRAAVTGDYVLLASEVYPVMRTLRSGGFEITALHTHMLDERPRLYFMHFWAVADAARLATTLRAALDVTNVRRN